MAQGGGIVTPAELKAVARDRVAAELAVAPGPLRFAVAVFQGLHRLGRIGGERPPAPRHRVTVIDTTAIEVETRRGR